MKRVSFSPGQVSPSYNGLMELYRNTPVLVSACPSCSEESAGSSCSYTSRWASSGSRSPARPWPSRWRTGCSGGCWTTWEEVWNGESSDNRELC